MTTEAQVYHQLDEGNHNGAVKEAKTIKPRFDNSNAPFEIKITAITREYGIADLYLDMSTDYDDNGNRRVDRSLEILKELGLNTPDMSKLSTLVGKPISFFGKKSSGGYLNFFVSKNFEVEVKATDANAALAQILGTNTGHTPPPTTNSQDGLMKPKTGNGSQFDPFAGDVEEEPPF